MCTPNQTIKCWKLRLRKVRLIEPWCLEEKRRELSWRLAVEKANGKHLVLKQKLRNLDGVVINEESVSADKK